MRFDEWLRAAQATLETAGIGTARLDVLVLGEDLLGSGRARLLAYPETELEAAQVRILAEQIERRARHEPLAYIRQRAEFYGRVFYVDKRVLVPRPESEAMIGLLKQLMANNREAAMKQSLTISDIGSGSGCLGVTAALELGPQRTAIEFYDIDPEALAVTELNAKKHGISGQFYQSDLLTGVGKPANIILANLPYVPDDHLINDAAGYEPPVALFGGPDGLDLYRRMFDQISAMKSHTRPRYVLTESMPEQHDLLADIATGHDFKIIKQDGYAQLFVRTP